LPWAGEKILGLKYVQDIRCEAVNVFTGGSAAAWDGYAKPPVGAEKRRACMNPLDLGL
jgi:hypothetical protein